jgi:ketosteroid isomerase-like protein
MSASRDTITAVYDAFGRGDVPAVLGMFDPAIEWNEAEHFLYAGGNPYRGPEAVLNGVFLPIVGDVDGFSVSPEGYIADGDTVAVEGRYRGTWKATGTPVDAQFVHVWRLRNGKVIRFQQYTDTLQWARAAGK